MRKGIQNIFSTKGLAIAIILTLGVINLQAQDIVRIKNRWMKDGRTEYKIHIQNATVDAGATQANWWSAQWVMERVPNTEFYRFKNRWMKDGKTNYYLHNQNGKIEASAIQAGWWSAQWKLEPIGDGKHYRISNRWKPNQYLHIEQPILAVGPIQPNWYSAQWELEGFKKKARTSVPCPSASH